MAGLASESAFKPWCNPLTTKTLQIGDRVRLTGRFLRNTGQHTGPEGRSVWTITGFSTAGPWAITDEPSSLEPGYYTPQELEQDPTLKFRRIALDNLEKVRARK
jgi:hypothetical protein